jgi:hypothetical protein
MAVLTAAANDEMLISCNCGCDEGMRLRIDKDEDLDDVNATYAYQSFSSGDFYTGQGSFRKKLRKIWAIIRNKDFYYSEICMSKAEFEEFKAWVNKH